MRDTAVIARTDRDGLGVFRGEAVTDAGKSVDLKLYWSIVRRNWKLALGIFVAVIVVGLVLTLLMTPIYEATTTVQIEREGTRALNIEEIQPVEQAVAEERFLETQVELIESRSNAEAVMRVLHLDSAQSHFALDMHARPIDEGMPPNKARIVRSRQVISLLSKNFDVLTSRNSRIVKLSFQSPDPQLSARVVNAFAQSYIAGNLDRRFQSSTYARDFLEQRLGQVKDRLEASERQVIDYARDAKLLDASSGTVTNSQAGAVQDGPHSLTAANLVALNATYAGTQGVRLQNEGRWRQANSSALFDLPEVQANQTIQELSQKRALLQGDYQDQLKIYKPDYPTVRELTAQIDEITSQINRQAGEIRNAIHTQYLTSLEQERDIQGQIVQLKGDLFGEQSRGIRYNILRREADTNRQLYDALLQRYKEVSVGGGSTSNNVSIVDSAIPPSQPERPSLPKNLMLAALAGAILALVIVIARDHFDDTVRSPDDLSTKLGLPLVGIVPAISGLTPGEALESATSDISESYSSIRTALQFASSHGVPTPLLVTSSQQSEGKSTTSFAIAKSFAGIGRKVLLIDGDLRRPSLHNLLGLPREVGLSNVLSDQTTLAEAIQSTSIPNVYFLAGGPLPLNPSELLASSKLPEALAEAAADFDLVLIDGPPIMGFADAPLISAQVAATLFVIEARRTHRGQSKVALSRIRAANGLVIGGVLTKFDGRNNPYGGDYAYAYRYDYHRTQA
jgi:succinoglycan biosynthesis transport protein ExoP